MEKTKKILYSVLKEINEGNKELSYNVYGIDKEKFGEIIEVAVNEGLLRNLTGNESVSRAGIGAKVIFVNTRDLQITIKGIEYLESNSVLAKGYKGLNEIRQWMDTISNFIPK